MFLISAYSVNVIFYTYVRSLTVKVHLSNAPVHVLSHFLGLSVGFVETCWRS